MIETTNALADIDWLQIAVSTIIFGIGMYIFLRYGHKSDRVGKYLCSVDCHSWDNNDRCVVCGKLREVKSER